MTIPEVSLPAVALGAGGTGETSEGPVTEPAVVQETVRQEQVCQQEAGPGGIVREVVRPALLRPTLLRPTVLRPALSRPPVCGVSGECTAGVDVPGVEVQPVEVAPVEVPPAVLEARTLTPDVGVLQGQRQTAYTAPADVLFAFGSADLDPRAQDALRAIAAEIRSAGVPGALRVEGHTDSVGDDAANQDLSERRARAVAGFLAAGGGLPAGAMTVAGLGEAAPVASNTRPDGSDDPDGRARNRRVVVTVDAT